MKNIFLSVVVMTTLIAGGVGGTFAGFVDTEVSEDNSFQAGISDLLINGKNDPIGAKLQYTHGAPGKSVDFWIDAYNWGECQGGDLYMHIKGVLSIEAGTKLHDGVRYVYTGDPDDGDVGDVPVGYREAAGTEPIGAGVWSSEPEKISEVGDGLIAEYYISVDDTSLLGEDYASGIADHLDFFVEVPIRASDGYLGNPDDPAQNAGATADGEVSQAERTLWTTNGNSWLGIASLSGKLKDIECNKNLLGRLLTQEKTFIHVDVVLQQVYADEWVNADGSLWPVGSAAGVDYDLDGDIDNDDFQKAGWPTNALQGDKATWDMLFELITDP
jgi:predicted ribosomally synthesized peptide with SipW-like signal peptide